MGLGRVAGSKNRTPKISGKQLKAVIKRYEAGESTRDIGTALGFSDGTIARYLRNAGILLRSAGFQQGEQHHQWRGGRILVVGGYIQVRLQPDDPFFCMAMQKAKGASYVFEHRLVMAKQLGRPLEDHETVHHIDGDRTNNDPSNLQLRSGRHGSGVALRCANCGSCNITSVAIQPESSP